MRQLLGSLIGLVTSFVIVFTILALGLTMPEVLIGQYVVQDFLTRTDLELKLAIVGTVLYPPVVGTQLSLGSQHVSVLMFLAWGTGGLVGGLISRDIIRALFAAVSSVMTGALLTWLLLFLVTTTDVGALLGSASMLLLQYLLEGCVYPAASAIIGGLLGGAISRQRA
ncbi:MAG: hypothetical protein QXS20_06240 [Candidatus Thorarchaeota archaeon]